jgi:hypothetical protein
MKRGRPSPRLNREQRTPIATAMLLFVALINILQLWLLTATVHAYLGGDRSVLWPAGLASAGCFLLVLGLLWYLYRLER